MRHYYFKNKSLINLIFGVCVLSYLLLSLAGPILHNHHDGKEHHDDCPVCQFLDVAAFFDIPEEESTVIILYQLENKVYLSEETFFCSSYIQSFLGRAPPGIFSI